MSEEKISREEAAWLAGIIDGEGSICINYNKARRCNVLRLTVGNTNPFMIQKIGDIWTKLGAKFYYSLKKPGLLGGRLGHKEALDISIIGLGSLKKVLLEVRPYLTAKLPQANLALEFLEWRFERGFKKLGRIPDLELARQYEEVTIKMKALNHTGFILQRLQRTASTRLSLEGLGIVGEDIV